MRLPCLVIAPSFCRPNFLLVELVPGSWPPACRAGNDRRRLWSARKPARCLGPLPVASSKASTAGSLRLHACTAPFSFPICSSNMVSSPSKSSRRHAAHFFSGSSRNNCCPAWLHSLRFRCMPLVQRKVLQFVFHPAADHHQLVPMQHQLSQVALL